MIRSRLVVTKETALAPRGMVVAEHPLGAEVGAAVLARGGNAVDAAVATAFAMTVVEPFMSTIGGSGTMLVHLAREEETLALDFNVVAPAAAHASMYRLAGGVSAGLFAWPRVEDDANAFGARSAAVPGSVAGLALALERFGTMELRDVVAPAVRLAREGFVPDWYLALTTARWMEELSAFPETARTYLRDGRWLYRPPYAEPGDRVRYPELAESLALIGREGPEAFYRGPIADAIEGHMRATGGHLGKADLAAYRVRIDPALRGRYRDLDLALSPGSTGGATALEILNVLEQFRAEEAGWRTVRGLHVRAEGVRRAFLDRFALLGDPEVVKAPWERLVSKEYAREVAAEIRQSKGRGAGGSAQPPERQGVSRGHTAPRPPEQPRRPRRTAVPRPGSPGPGRGAEECTTHVSVVDRRRNMVALTHTALSIFGSRVVVPGTGILLNNGMFWFDPEPGHANSIAPGKRALVNMVPALGFRKGRPYLTIGAPGGRKILSAIPQVIANLVDGRCSLQAAIEAPRLHDEGGGLLVDERVGARALAALVRLGHTVIAREETYATLNFAKPVAIRVTAKGLEAGLDHLRPAAAAGH